VLISPARLYGIADVATRSLTTDSGLGSVTGFVEFAESLTGLDPGAVDTLTMPVAYDTRDPNRVVAAEPQAARLWEALREDQAVPASVRTSSAHGGDGRGLAPFRLCEVLCRTAALQWVKREFLANRAGFPLRVLLRRAAPGF
jgi:hypothetical protein